MSTDKPPPLRGYRESQETHKEAAPVDPKRFKEELSKVTESDEAQQQKKRNSKKTEEEIDEDELQPKQQIAASGDLFSLFMNDTESSSVMKPQTPQNVRSTEAPSSSSSFTIEEDTPSSPSMPSTSPDFAPGIAAPTPSLSSHAQNFDAQSDAFKNQEGSFVSIPEQDMLNNTPSSFSTSSPEETHAQAPSTEIAGTSSQKSPARVAKKETQDTSLLAKKAPSAAHLGKQKKEVSPAEIKLTPSTPKPNAPHNVSKPTAASKQPLTPTPQQKTPLPQTAATPTPQVPLTLAQAPLRNQHIPAEVRPQIDLNKEHKPARFPSDRQALAQEVLHQGTKTHSDTSDEKSKDRDEKKESELSAPTQTTPIVPFTPAPIEQAPAYATLSPQVYELFEKMMGLMTIEQNNGVTTTTVTVNMKDSVFNGAQIILDHYSTAPNAFNVTIAGSPQAQELVNANLASLIASFEQSKLAFQINLRSPILLEEHQVGKRRKRPGDEENPEEKRQKK